MASYSGVVGYEIAAITDAIMKNAKGADGCSSNCFTIKNDTPITYNGVIQSATVISGGTEYFPVIPKVVVNGDGLDAEVGLTIDNGVIVGVDVINAGYGYTFATLDITDTYGTAATFTIDIVGGIIDSVTVDDGGQGYVPIFPEIVLGNFGNGVNARLEAVIDLSTGAISFVNVLNGGSGYSLDTVAYVVASEFSNGSGAEIKLGFNGCSKDIIDSSMYYDYVVGQSDRCNASRHINQIKSHFRALGYTIRAMVNPDTNTTIMWEVCWC